MRLHVKHFRTDKHVDICDDYDNVKQRFNYETEHMGVIMMTRVNTYLQAYCEGWSDAKNSILNCDADPRIINVDALNNPRHPSNCGFDGPTGAE